jgi:hypothetical protein
LGYNILPAELSGYGRREQTETDHLQKILAHLNFRKWQPLFDVHVVEKWLVEKGMVHDKERYLLDLLCQKLYSEKILRPAIGTLAEIVGRIREKLEKETYARLSFLWTTSLFEKLDRILEPDRELKITPHRWLCNIPGGNTSVNIHQMLEKYDFLEQLGVQSWDLSSLSENRKKKLAFLSRSNSNAHLQRMLSVRRYPVLVCFLKESLLDITDVIMLMYSDYWQQTIHKSKRALDSYLVKTVKSQQHALQTIIQTGKMVVDENIENEQLRKYIYQMFPKVQIQAALTTLTGKDAKSVSRYSFLSNHYSSIKRFSPKLLSTLPFKVSFAKDNFEAALQLVKELQNNRKKKIPQDAPMNFIGTNWQKVIMREGKINQQNYELCVLHVLKERLQSGDVYLELSRKFTSLESLLISETYWKPHKEDICQKISLPDLPETIDRKTKELFGILPLLTKKLSQALDIRLENDVLIVSPLVADEIPPTAILLKEQINARLPKVSLPEMIREVDTWINYSDELSAEQPSRNLKHRNLKYAVLFANACNLSLADLARSSDLEYQSLWWVGNNYFSDDNLKKANNLIVNHHYRQWISRNWGGGVLSSSDGQRFPTDGKIRNAKAIPKYFGYGKGVGIYTHTVTPSTLISKLQAYPRQNNLMYVLQSYGQLVKTIFICKYLLDITMRKKINAQLNKGEQLHGLRAYLWFGGDGVIRKKQENEQQITALSLNLLTNIVITWNTIYIQEIIKQLLSEGFEINEADFEHISPAPFEHINRLGKYSFDTDFEVAANGLRPLRNVSNF